MPHNQKDYIIHVEKCESNKLLDKHYPYIDEPVT
jgi:hypothetical protein